MNRPLYSSLLTKFLLAAALPLMLLLVFANVVYLYLKTDELRARHLNDVKNEVQLLASQLSIPVWQFDKETVISLVNTLEDSAYIVCATLEEYESYSVVVRQSHKVGTCSEAEISTLETVKADVIYDYDGEMIKTGVLEVMLDLSQVGDSLTTSLLNELILFILYVVIFLIGFTVALKETVLKPLRMVHASILSYQNTGNRELVEWKSKDELGTLISEYNKNLTGMDKAEQALKDKNIVLEKANKEAEEAREVAEQTARAKSEFLANMSHEIRTPMNAIQGLAEMLSRTRLDAKQGGYLHRIRNSADILLAIINDILDFSKIEAGKLELESVEFSLSEIVEKVVDVESFVASNKGIELTVKVSDAIPDKLKGDSMRLCQVLINLISNAIKFTEAGEITIALELESRIADDIVIRGTITDTGVGISDEALQKLFQSFTQADGSTTRRFGGTGLGLAICKRLVELMGGGISAKSELGKGSEFSFTVRYSAIPEAQESTSPLDVFKGNLPAIMIVGDSRPCDELNTIFSRLDLSIQRITTGEGILNLLQALFIQQSTPSAELEMTVPVVIYVDITSVRISFSEVADKITQLNQPHKYKLVLILSVSQREKIVLEEGGRQPHAVLTKPILKRRAVKSLINALKSSNDEEFDVAADPVEEGLSGANILVVEDNQVNQLVAREMLEAAGVNVRVADDGEQALKRLEDQETVYDAVLMDIHMPVMDGYNATKAIREKYGNQLPVIALTANATTEEKKRCLNIGMNDFLTKPIDSDTLFKVLSHWVREGKEGDSYTNVNRLLLNDENADSDVEDEMNQEEKVTPTVVASEDVIDMDKLAFRFKSHPTIIPRIFKSFKECFCDFEAEFMAARDAEDDETMHRLAHSLKGSASNLSADRLTELSADLEQKLKDNQLIEALEWFPWVVDHLSKVLIYIDEYLKNEETK
ncbi:ATP-binding protein [Alkalimarinus alittae]|uniref:histidine kinase n=1 Tax=Alkalimarinus alittae TaxID=2961619 RepID=A0ABY6N027_9ALTE|nr:ATP-binding protein [Alkalimarinus alittae]UZE95442.1 ATP-binding protein [Alkalimarinus alittae]